MSTPESVIVTVALAVSDQDRALEFYRGVLGFEVRRDVPMGPGSRWIEVAPPGSPVTVALVAEGSGVPLGIRIATPHIDLTREALQRAEIDVDDAVIRTAFAPAMFALRDPDGNPVVVLEAQEES
ncbi:VOC family protein [uncultured Amnibacterium sp.]|uniref:VOC family protein n=1 Tax=uncultured Amnibacterium sp. TaxID=1631851 RepID=UPI0035CC2D83